MITRAEIFDYVKEKYKTNTEHMFLKHPDVAVLRNPQTNKWYGVVMNIEKRKLGINEDGYMDVINLKGNPEFNSIIRSQKHIIAAYHMNKKHWVTVLLDYEFPKSELHEMIDWSYQLTSKKKK
jgi:predicted DNA-binding protein (MmcQ/YjbR family)